MNERFIEGLVNVSSKFQQNRVMTIIRDAFTELLPFTIAGSFAVLFLNVITSTADGAMSLARLPGLSGLQNLAPIFNAANYATMNIISLLLLVFVARQTAIQSGHQETMPIGIALSSFVTLCATSVVATAVKSGEEVTVNNVLASTYTNSSGMFLALVVGIVSVDLYYALCRSEHLKIKLPDEVPPNIAASFNSLIPCTLVILIFATVNCILVAATGVTVFAAITKFIQAPLHGALTGLPGYLLSVFMMCFLWCFGLHGTLIIGAITSPFMLQAITENLEAVSVGDAPVNIINTMFSSNYMAGGGTGQILGLIIAILLFSKVDAHRAIAKLGLVPSLFNISEPIMFGLPVVMNPIFMIPFIIAPIGSSLLGYLLTKAGMAIPFSYNMPFTIPPLIKAFLASGGHFGNVIVAALCLALSVAIYTPFVFVANKQEEKRLEKGKEDHAE